MTGCWCDPLPTCFPDGITKRHVMGLVAPARLRVEERTVTLDEPRAVSVFTAGNWSNCSRWWRWSMMR